MQWTPGDSQNDPAAWDAYRGDPPDPISKDWVRAKFESGAELGLIPGRPLGPVKLFGAAPLGVPDEESGDHLLVDWAIAQMRAPQPKPLFPAVGLFRPHIPWEVPQKWFDLYPLAGVKLPVIQADDLAEAHDHGRRSWHRWVLERRAAVLLEIENSVLPNFTGPGWQEPMLALE